MHLGERKIVAWEDGTWSAPDELLRTLIEEFGGAEIRLAEQRRLKPEPAIPAFDTAPGFLTIMGLVFDTALIDVQPPVVFGDPRNLL
jgi:hypothetical protein